jgi:hypothetical protein
MEHAALPAAPAAPPPEAPALDVLPALPPVDVRPPVPVFLPPALDPESSPASAPGTPLSDAHAVSTTDAESPITNPKSEYE